jgi:predicted DNA-binding WGR domain protein
MATQIVMDHSGDSRHFFNASSADALAEAERLFLEFTRKGYTAAVRSAPGEVTRVTTFDPTAEETLFFPRLVGG